MLGGALLHADLADALRKGHAVVIVRAQDHHQADAVQNILWRHGAESIDARITSYNVCYTKLLRIYLVNSPADK